MKWVLLGVVIVIAVMWARINRNRSAFSEPEIKEVEQKRFYVTPPKPEDPPLDDHQNDRY